MSRGDRAIFAALIGVPLLIQVMLVWLPGLATVGLSLTSWNGVGEIGPDDVVGLANFADLLTSYPAFWPAFVHTVIWLAVFVFVATPIGMALAAVLDRELRGTRFYQTALYLPVVLSLAVIGLIWELQFAPEQGFVNSALGTTGQDELIDWLGDRDLNLWAVLVAASWRHVGYVVVLYLAGLRSVDPSMREAASMDGASEIQTFRRVIFPAMRPINVIIVVVTVVEALRAFDIVYVINRGTNGLETLAVLVANNILGEASRVGFGSAVATILLGLTVVPILIFVRWALREEAD
jgi:multiple sugar transport system permease protein